MLAKTRASEEEVKEEVVVEETSEEVKAKPKQNFGSILFNAVFIAMVSSFLAVDAVKIFKTGALDKEGVPVTPVNSYIQWIVLGVTFLSMFVCDILEKKCNQKWLSSFGLGLSIVMGMISAVIVNLLVM